MTEEFRKILIETLRRGEDLPPEWARELFPPDRQEYELVYSGKEREEDILAETMAVPLQPIKMLGKGGNSGWVNKLIFGDNLQVLKTLYEDPVVKGKVKLIYIDPPFATKQEFRGPKEQKAYQDKLIGVLFLEFLRKRLVLLKELLSAEGFIFIHLDWHRAHYVKVLMDEIFEERNFRNEIILPRPFTKNLQQQFERTKTLNVRHDTLLFYSREPDSTFPLLWVQKQEVKHPEGHWHHFWSNADRPTMRYKLFGITPQSGQWIWEKEKALQAAKNYERYLKEANGRTLLQFWIDTGKELRFIKKGPDGKPLSWRPPAEKQLADTVWLNVQSYENQKIYPTQKHEELLSQLITSFSDKNDIVLDAFAGSGTALAVAEKLGRRWIGIDSSKLAIYTIQKRMLNLRSGIGNKIRVLTPKSFTVYNAGLYDYKLIKNLPRDESRDFALRLFQCRDDKHKVSGIELDGYLGEDHVLVFQWHDGGEIVLDRGFIDDLHRAVGKKVGRKFFIIAPASTVVFLEDYIEKDDTKYYVLRIPYSIIEEIHDKGFEAIKQPVSEMDVNDVVDAVGFDFVQIPEIECEYKIRKADKKTLFESEMEAVIKVRKFRSNVLSRKPLEFKNLETLSMVMMDYNFNGEVFDIDDYWFADQIAKDANEVRFDPAKVDKQMMIIYMDIFGNEKREIKTLKDFNSKQDAR